MARETEWVPVLDAKGVVEPYREPGQGRGWLTLLLGLIVFAAFGGVVGYAYLNGLPGIGGEPPLIRAAAEPYRRAPSDRGGLEVANSSSSIVSVLRQQNEQLRVERILPPEASLALESGEPEPEPAPEADAPVEPDVTAPLAPPAAQSQPDQPGAATGDNATTDTAATATTALMPPPKPAPPVQLAAREPPATISALPRPAPAVAPPVAVAQPARPPVAQPAPAPAPVAPVQARVVPAPAPAAVPPRVVAPAVAPGAGPQRLVRADPAAPAAVQPSPAGAGVYRLQLTAVRSESGLTKAWADLRDRYPAALASVSPQVERTQTSSGPLFRLQAGPFANREAAANACVTIRSTGGQCFIVGPLAP